MSPAHVVSDFPLMLTDTRGAMLDEHAIAHDLSEKGCRAETVADLQVGQDVRCRFVINKTDLRCTGRVTWAQRTDFAVWSGVEFRGLSWYERRVLRDATQGPRADWLLIAGKALFAVCFITAALGLWFGMLSAFWRPQIVDLIPKAFAAVALGWSIREMLSPDRPDR
jgi:hypothetical protein